MELRAGYKQTEVGVIPEDWDCRRLTSIAKLESGHTPSRRNLSYWDGNIPWISLHDSAGLDVPVIYQTVQTMGPIGLANSSARLLPKGTVVFSRTATVGKATVMGREMTTSQDFANYICGKRVHNHFLVYLFRSMERQWKRLMAGSTHNSIYMPAFRELQIPLPPIAEQEAIAGALSDADGLIESLEQLIAKKRHLKQGAMQQLLTGKKRLPGFSSEWEVKMLGDLASLNKGTQLSSGKTSEYGRFPHLNGGMMPSSYTDKSNTPSDTIAISEGGNSCGYVQFMAEPFWCGGHCYSVFPHGVDNHFLFQALKIKEPSIMGLRVGSGLPNVQKTALLEFKVRIPISKDEQEAIAAVLSDMDGEIERLETKLGKVRQLKAGMMHNLLTGRIRLV
jgi:type I restriction enzyme, S subunit